MSERPSDLRVFNGGKRVVDLLVVLATAPVWVPLTAVVAVVVALRLGRPVLFRQQRVGLDETFFDVLKFRTMTDATGPDGALLPDRDRLTATGRRLRSLSLDELPQLVNVLRGDMSLIGPRPLFTRYLSAYTALERTRHLVRPGITGWAQVNGRNWAPWDDRLALDAEYVRRHRWRDDVTILARTVRQVLRGEDVAVLASESGRPLDVERGRPVALEPLTVDDLAHRVAWMRDERLRAHMQLPEDPTLEETTAWFERRATGPERHDFVAWDRVRGRRVAMAGLTSGPEGRATFYVFVDPDLLGEGYGAAVTRAVVEQVRTSSTFRGCALTVARSNERAVRLYRGLGFHVVSATDDRWEMVKDV